ncbi:hypothetical protein DPMN_095276 [Dreissena polymorpha]|uniref:Uncharacterized protein n=1 Tax=Dreissena polymorpha TaxID=45954 RepID=A0A9D4L6K6_DREPO|nr:hypothetical protein DPMN_095276 [Dreissena polymorpha]
MYDFPSSSSSPRIPQFIHQTYKTEAIPMDFQKNVQSCMRFIQTGSTSFGPTRLPDN